MIKISHESPLALLDESLTYNDYQYILPYFWDRYEEYSQFMLDYRKKEDSFIILDNGLFEGEVKSNVDLIELIEQTQPDIFIVPDEWNDAKTTYNNAKLWNDTLIGDLPERTKLMVVLQGNTFEEIANLYEDCIELGYTHFALNHSSALYQRNKFSDNKLENQCIGRISLLEGLIMADILKQDHYIHLLGASLVKEFLYYKEFIDYGWVNSIDTSNPIIAGMLLQEYNNTGLEHKPSQKMEEFFENTISNNQRSIINKNIKQFKKIVNG